MTMTATRRRAVLTLKHDGPPVGTPPTGSDIELIGHKDNPIGGFRLWKKGELFAATIMDDEDTLTDDPQWDLMNWLDNMEDPSAQRFMPAIELYPIFYRQAPDHHGAWNVCNILQDYLPANVG